MDVPSWHPANEDASLTRQLTAKTAASSQRTEFKLMPGSTTDLSTEAGRELLNELTDGGSAAVEGRGFFDSSDRMYLKEQRRLEAERHQKTRAQDLAELQKFRSTALKVQAQKAAALTIPDVTLDAKKKPATANPTAATSTSTTAAASVVVIKTKKRSATSSSNVLQSAKQLKPSDPEASKSSPKKSAAPTTSLLLGYSSSSDSDSDSEADITTGSSAPARF